ncbi:hypothetical protein HYDPIDRAFT_107491 [Hydnomerulius pinastri MD-312]|nr:hypothetical protein HYDPIDRAFT_107491 [Hydnomerulius pinastri MD-312]
MNSLRDNIKRREACFGEAWGKLQKMGFSEKAELPQYADIPLSPSLIPNTPYSPAPGKFPSCYFGGPSRQAARPKVSMNADKGALVFSSSSTPYQDDNICIDLPSGMRRGLVRTNRVTRRRPVICPADRPHSNRRLPGQHEALDDPTAEFRRYIDATVAETARHHHDSRRRAVPPPSPVEDEVWDDVKSIMLALERNPSLGSSSGSQGSPGLGRPPLHSMESTISTSELVLDGPALFHGCSPVMPQIPYVTFDDLPERIKNILSQSAMDSRPSISRNETIESISSRPLHEDVLCAYQALRETEPLPDYFGNSRRGLT